MSNVYTASGVYITNLTAMMHLYQYALHQIIKIIYFFKINDGKIQTGDGEE